jgi:hypothetical protein
VLLSTAAPYEYFVHQPNDTYDMHRVSLPLWASQQVWVASTLTKVVDMLPIEVMPADLMSGWKNTIHQRVFFWALYLVVSPPEEQLTTFAEHVGQQLPHIQHLL